MVDRVASYTGEVASDSEVLEPTRNCKPLAHNSSPLKSPATTGQRFKPLADSESPLKRAERRSEEVVSY